MQEIREKAKLIGMLLTPDECNVLYKILHSFNVHEPKADIKSDEVCIVLDMICDLGKMRIGNNEKTIFNNNRDMFDWLVYSRDFSL